MRNFLSTFGLALLVFVLPSAIMETTQQHLDAASIEEPVTPASLSSPEVGGFSPWTSTEAKEVRGLLVLAFEAEGHEWGAQDVESALELCWLESRFTPTDQNPESSAFGLYQFLDSTWQYYGVDKTSDPYMQTVAFVRYASDRYGTPTKALAFWKTKHVVNGKQVNYY